MILIRDALTLAFTKLQTRRIRTAVGIVVASLLFGVIAGAAFVLQGSTQSLSAFNANSLANRYLAVTTYTTPISFVDAPNQVKTRARDIYNETVKDKQALAKQFDISYDPTTEPLPTTKLEGQETLNSSSPAAIKALNEYIASQPSAVDKLRKLLARYHPTRLYTVTSSSANGGQFKTLVDGKEDFSKVPSYPASGTPDIGFGWSYLDQSVVGAFMLPSTQLATQKDTNDIPVVAPISKVEQALGLRPLASNAPSSDKLARIQYVRDHAARARFSVCYRNSVSQMQIQDAITTAQELEQNKDNKNYQKPHLIYGLPDASTCAAAPISQDTRTPAEKDLDNKQQKFQQASGQPTEPIQQRINFRVVGLSPDKANLDSLSGVGGLLSTMVSSSLEGQWIVPQELYEAMPNRGDYDHFLSTVHDSTDDVQFDSARIVAEFASAQDVKNFVSSVGCGNSYCGGPASATYFGSNSALLNDLKNQATTVLGYGAIVVTFVALIIMMSVVGRVISDSRHETAVFRAIGAKRSDIGCIYIAYTCLLAIMVVVTTLLMGYVIAAVLNAVFSPELTVQAHITYIFAPNNLSFTLNRPWWKAVALLTLLVVMAALLGVSLPLIRNVKRSPIQDMRDDT